MMSIFMRMQKFTIPIIMLVAVGVNVSSYFIGRIYTDPGKTFLGAVHYPRDYFYYLSFISQAKYRTLLSIDQNAIDPLPPIVFNWMYTALGKIGNLLLFPPDITYQVGVILFSLLYLLVSYALIQKLLPGSKTQQTIAYIFFLTAGPMPLIFHTEAGWALDARRPWYSYGNALTRLTNVPSHLAIQMLIMATLLLSCFWLIKASALLMKQSHTMPETQITSQILLWSIFMLIIGAISASLQPLQWAMSSGILFLTSILLS